MLVGDTVVAAKKIIYASEPPNAGLNVVPQGMMGKVTGADDRGRRMVEFADGQVVEVGVKELTSPGALDRITKAIFTDL